MPGGIFHSTMILLYPWYLCYSPMKNGSKRTREPREATVKVHQAWPRSSNKILEGELTCIHNGRLGAQDLRRIWSGIVCGVLPCTILST